MDRFGERSKNNLAQLMDYLESPENITTIQGFFAIKPPSSHYSCISNGKTSTNNNGFSYHKRPTQQATIGNKFWFYFFRFASSLANETFSTILFANLFWNFNHTIGRQLTLCWFSVMFTGQLLKDVLKMPRARSLSVVVLEPNYANEYGMPSTHAMAGACIPFTMAHLIAKYSTVSLESIIPFSLVWCLSVTISRMYLGMHSLLDLIGGLFITCLIISPIYPMLDLLDHFMLFNSYWPLIALVIMISLGLLYPEPKPKSPTRGDSCTILGAYTGMTIGNWANINWRLIPFTNSITSIEPFNALIMPNLVALSMIRFCLGLMVVLLVKVIASKLVLKLLATLKGLDYRDQAIQHLRVIEVPHKLVTYVLVGFAITSLVPCILYQLRI